MIMSYPIRWLWLIYRFCISIFIIIFIMLLVFIIIIMAFFNIVNSIFVFVITFIPTDGPMFHKLSFHSFISLAGSFIARQSSSKNLFDLHYTIRDPPMIFLSSYQLLEISNAFRPCLYKNLHLLYPEYSAYLFFFYLKMTKAWFCQFLLRISITGTPFLIKMIQFWYDQVLICCFRQFLFTDSFHMVTFTQIRNINTRFSWNIPFENCYEALNCRNKYINIHT